MYDGADLIGVLDNAGNALHNFTFGPDLDRPLGMSRAGDHRYFHVNHLGSVMALTMGSGIISQYSYDPYGKTQVTGETLNRFRYTAREQDTEDLYYYRARYYDPTLQRFLQSDPIGLAGSINIYSYVRGNPVIWRDPLGLRLLTLQEKTLLGPYIPQPDLDNAHVHVDEMPWYAPEWAVGITRGNDIYFRNPQQTFCTPQDVALLGHELIHVGQYREGMTWLSYLWASRTGYESNPYEISAYELQRKI